VPCERATGPGGWGSRSNGVRTTDHQWRLHEPRSGIALIKREKENRRVHAGDPASALAHRCAPLALGGPSGFGTRPRPACGERARDAIAPSFACTLYTIAIVRAGVPCSSSREQRSESPVVGRWCHTAARGRPDPLRPRSTCGFPEPSPRRTVRVAVKIESAGPHCRLARSCRRTQLCGDGAHISRSWFVAARRLRILGSSNTDLAGLPHLLVGHELRRARSRRMTPAPVSSRSELANDVERPFVAQHGDCANHR
jgi:hypothetical protein